MIRNALIIPALVVTVVGASLWATSQTFAQDKVTDPQASLVQKIADRFNLNKDDVQKVFDEEKIVHKTQMKQHFEDKLSQLAKEGKITEEQKIKILNKLQSEHANREATREKMKSMTPEERKEHMKTRHEELKTWAQENGINLQDIFSVKHKDDMKIKMGWR